MSLPRNAALVNGFGRREICGRRSDFSDLPARWHKELVLALTVAPAAAQTDPLPSWEDGAAKAAIVDFVTG